MDDICLKHLKKIKESLIIKKSELDISRAKTQLNFSQEEEIAEGITNRCKEDDLLELRQLIENLNSNDDNLSYI